MWNRINEAAGYLRSLPGPAPVAGIVLGTGLGGLTQQIVNQTVIPYGDIPGFPPTTVEGHSGNLIFGQLAGLPVVAMQGRFHYYEGYPMEQVAFPIRVLKILGIKQLFLSNAAGGINPAFGVGDLMVIRDHINFFPESPLRGPNIEELGPRFPDMTEPYDQKLINLAHQTAEKLGFPLREGVYVGNPGPSFETPAEYLHYRIIGGDAIGMSTIPEVIVARHMELPVFGVSVITNVNIPGSFEKNSHEDVQEAASRAGSRLIALFAGLLPVSPYSPTFA
ncbi:MAG: purine-nucleoside phosphorylase [Bacteroidales bacterium]